MRKLRYSIFPTKLPPGLSIAELEPYFEQYVLRVFLPEAPFLSPTSRVASIGSCFAEEISKSLAQEGLNCAHVMMSERWNSAFALQHYLSKALRGTPFPKGLIFDASQLNHIPEDMAETFRSADVFILTFGLSLCWFDVNTDRLTLEPALKNPLGEGKGGLALRISGFEMRQTSVQDNVDAIEACIRIIQDCRPSARIVLTLSPVPLEITTHDRSVIAANAVSKATLRVAIDSVMARKPAAVSYWPSYECVTWLGNHVMPSFGIGALDLRHVRPDLVAEIARMFKKYYFLPDATTSSPAIENLSS